MSTCLTWAWSMESLDKLMAALLLQRIGVALFVMLNLMPLRKVQNHMHSWVLSNMAMYSALQDEVATDFCFQATHEMMPKPRLQA